MTQKMIIVTSKTLKQFQFANCADELVRCSIDIKKTYSKSLRRDSSSSFCDARRANSSLTTLSTLSPIASDTLRWSDVDGTEVDGRRVERSSSSSRLTFSNSAFVARHCCLGHST